MIRFAKIAGMLASTLFASSCAITSLSDLANATGIPVAASDGTPLVEGATISRHSSGAMDSAAPAGSAAPTSMSRLSGPLHMHP